MWPFKQKLNPAQSDILDYYGENHDSDPRVYTYQTAYNDIEVVNRGVNLIVDGAAAIPVDVGAKVDSMTTNMDDPDKRDIRKKKLAKLLNFNPNPYMTADTFNRNIYLDIILNGNAFIYWDGGHLYNLPAEGVDIIIDKKKYIKAYTYSNTKFKPSEIIHIKDNASNSIFRGTSRMKSADGTVKILKYMTDYQTNFFKNHAIPGIVLKTPNVLSKKIKDRITLEWQQKYSIATKGGRTPIILDGEFSLENLNKNTYKDLDFAEGVKTQEEKILKALGVPSILLDTGNNANITPNLRLFYINTILPINRKVISGLERFFGYDLKPILQDVQALRPELNDQAKFLSTLVNAGIMTRNEARDILRLDKSDSDIADDLILPANVAGSAADPGTGGKPPSAEEGK